MAEGNMVGLERQAMGVLATVMGVGLIGAVGPEILATLYQLGFEKSRPKPDPRPNRFGERVRQAYESPWMRAHFRPAP